MQHLIISKLIHKSKLCVYTALLTILTRFLLSPITTVHPPVCKWDVMALKRGTKIRWNCKSSMKPSWGLTDFGDSREGLQRKSGITNEVK